MTRTSLSSHAMRIRWAVVFMLLALSVLAAAGRAHADGPWKGQIVDAETGAPLADVVVLAYWTKFTGSIGGWAGGDFVDAEETVTGPDGRFAISAHSTFSLWPWNTIRGDLKILKTGYGQWTFRGGNPSRESIWKRLERGEEIVEMPRLRTREERRTFYHQRWGIPTLVPGARAPRLSAAEDIERAYLGYGR